MRLLAHFRPTYSKSVRRKRKIVLIEKNPSVLARSSGWAESYQGSSLDAKGNWCPQFREIEGDLGPSHWMKGVTGPQDEGWIYADELAQRKQDQMLRY